jgi:beta-lactamase regulating signal transducer with metallopeptidase domain
MNDLLSSVQAWWVGSAVGGGTVLLLASLLAKRAKNTSTVQRFGEWGVAAALLVAALRLGPTWWEVPDPRPAPQHVTHVAVAPAPQAAPMPQPVDLAWMPVGVNDVVRDVPPIYQHLPPQTPTAAALPVVESPTSAASPIETASLVDSLLLAYAAVAGLLLLRWLAGQWALARLIRQGRSAPEPVQQVFDRMAVQTGQTETRLLVSNRVPVPMCCGLRTPTVVIPRSLVLRNDPAVWRWVFTHELTHLARRDTWSTWALGLAQAIYFYVPWFWSLKRQIRLCQEYVADAAAAAQGPWADDYAQFLVSLAHCPAAPQGATGVLGQTSDLYRRVTMVLQPKTGGPSSRRQLVSGIACLLASAVVFAGLGVRAASPDGDNKDGDGKIDIKPEIRVEVILDDDAKKDDDKKDGEKKAELKKRFVVGSGGAMGGIDKAEIEKKVRKALEKAKLADEEVDKIIKEITKSLDQAKIAVALAPLAGQHIAGDAMKHLEIVNALPSGNVFFHGDGNNPVVVGAGGRWANWPSNGRLGIVADKPSIVLIEQLDLPKDHGLVITEIRKNSAAEKAGLHANDIVLVFAGQKVPNDTMKFIELLDGVSSDKEVDAVILRKGKKEVVTGIKLAEKVDPKAEGEKTGVLYKKAVEAAGAHAGKGEGNKSEKSPNKSTSVMINDGEFKATEKEDDLSITVIGTTENKKVNVTSVAIKDTDFAGKFSSIDEVPSKYRARVKKLISNSGDSPIRFDFRKE